MENCKLIRLLSVIMMTLLCLTSCEKDNEKVSDPYDAAKIKMLKEKGEGHDIIICGNGAFYINISNYFERDPDPYWGDVSFVDVGPVENLSSIKIIPQSGWTNEASVIPSHGYVITDGSTYMRLYVEDYIYNTKVGGTDGAIVIIQDQWNP